METTSQKIRRNIKDGTLLRRGSVALKNRFIKWLKHTNIFYLFDEERVQTKKYQKDIPQINTNHIEAGNYYLDKRIELGQDSIVYSLGISVDISFDSFVASTYGCEVYMYDPTPISIEFMKQHEGNKLLKFKPVAVWTENTTLKFYEPAFGGSASAVYEWSEKYFEAVCFTMATLMKENNHTIIDVFKADIEGAALPILEQMIDNTVFPHQIIIEFERPRNDAKKVADFFESVSKIRTQLKERGYEEFLLPRTTTKYFSLEMLFVDTTKIKTA